MKPNIPTRIYLDFDGVINVLGTDVPYDCSSHQLGFHLRWRSELVEKLKSLSDEGVEIVWASTWCTDEYATTILNPMLGVNWRALPSLDFSTKYKEVCEDIRNHPVRCALWIDDDSPWAGESLRAVNPDGTIIVLSPNSRRGLSDQLLESGFSFDYPECISVIYIDDYD